MEVGNLQLRPKDGDQCGRIMGIKGDDRVSEAVFLRCAQLALRFRGSEGDSTLDAPGRAKIHAAR
jgi:hypothetical protein